MSEIHTSATNHLFMSTTNQINFKRKKKVTDNLEKQFTEKEGNSTSSNQYENSLQQQEECKT